MRRAAALERHVDVVQAEPRGHFARERIRAAVAGAAQVDQRAEVQPPRRRGQMAGVGWLER